MKARSAGCGCVEPLTVTSRRSAPNGEVRHSAAGPKGVRNSGVGSRPAVTWATKGRCYPVACTATTSRRCQQVSNQRNRLASDAARRPRLGRTVRRVGGGAAALIATMGSALVFGQGSVAYAAVVSYNPFAVNQGFTVVGQGDVSLGNAELEGSVAAFGTITPLRQNYAIIHQAAGQADYTVPEIDGTPVRILAQTFGGITPNGFAVTNRDDSGTIDPTSREATASAKFGDITGLTGQARGSNWLRVTNSGGATLDLEAVPYTADAVDGLKTAEDSVSAYFGDVQGQVDQANSCLSSMYTDAELGNHVTFTSNGGQLEPVGVDETMPNWVDYADIEGQTVASLGFAPTAQAPLVIRVPAGTTDLNAVLVDWDANPGGNQGYSRYVMWDLSQVTGTVRIDGVRFGSMWAPTADLDYDSDITING